MEHRYGRKNLHTIRSLALIYPEMQTSELHCNLNDIPLAELQIYGGRFDFIAPWHTNAWDP